MAIRKMKKLSPRGDDLIAEYETGVTSPARLAEIETEFKHMVSMNYFAVDITDKKDTAIRAFDPNADILMIPVVMGG